MTSRATSDDRQDDPGTPEGEARGDGDPGRDTGAGQADATPDGEGAESPADDGEGQPRDPEAELAEAKDRWLRARAELENVRRRARRDVEDAHAYGAAALLREVVSLLDDLQRALAAAPEDADAGLLEGLRITEAKFLTTLERQGVSPVLAEPGTPLDPECHRALVEQPSAEHPPGTIVTVISKGYRLRERLLREAEVVVARAPDPAQDPAPDSEG